MSALSSSRIATERKNWRRDHPFGFVAKPRTAVDGSTNLFIWDCKVPGKEGTVWQGGLFPVTITFHSSYPVEAPTVALPAGFHHPNVFENGQVCLSIIGKGWKPSIEVKQILLGVQELLDTPNEKDPANWRANDMYIADRAAYVRRAKEEARKYPGESGTPP